MLKNAIIYRIAAACALSLAAAEEGTAKATFQPCGATQQKSFGWIPPRGEENGALVESIGSQWIFKFMVESKDVPGDVLKRRVKEKAERIEKESGRKPGRKESKELKEEALLDLLPMAFTKEAATWVWVDPANRTVLIDSNSQAKADEIISLLVEALPGLSVSLLYTQISPTVAMSHWLTTQEPPVGFTVDRECELQSGDESKATVKYARHPLDIEEIQKHIAAGKLPTKLALTWDDRVSFVLTDGLQLKGIDFLDTVFEGKKEADKSGFDADVAISTGEMAALLPDLIEALGGESEPIHGAALADAVPA